MTDRDDDGGLTEGGGDRFEAIVAREWPDDAHRGNIRTTTDVDPQPTPMVEVEGDPTRITIYRPLRPGPLILFAGTASLAATLAVAAYWGVPAYQSATGHLLGRAARIDVAHDCGAIVAVLALGLVVSCALLGTWMVLWAQYSLRRTAVSAFQFADQITAGHRVHPPNIATALTWALLLATATAVAAWWMAYQCDLLAASAAMNDARTAVEQVTITAAAWCALLVGATICLSAWASREARHRLRVRALGHLNR